MARTQALDYLEQQRAAVAEDHVIMNFHMSNTASAGDAVFIEQLFVVSKVKWSQKSSRVFGFGHNTVVSKVFYMVT